jgi:hypothetical protein
MVVSARGVVVISKLELELSVISLLELAQCCLKVRALSANIRTCWNRLDIPPNWKHCVPFTSPNAVAAL